MDAVGSRALCIVELETPEGALTATESKISFVAQSRDVSTQGITSALHSIIWAYAT